MTQNIDLEIRLAYQRHLMREATEQLEAARREGAQQEADRARWDRANGRDYIEDLESRIQDEADRMRMIAEAQDRREARIRAEERLWARAS